MIENLLQELITSDLGETEAGVIGDNDIRNFFACPFSYAIKKFEDPHKAPLLAKNAMIIYLRNVMRSLHNLVDYEVGEIFFKQKRAGPDLLTASEMTFEELLKYQPRNKRAKRKRKTHTIEDGELVEIVENTRDIFANSALGIWRFITKDDHFLGRELAYLFPAEKGFSIPKTISRALKVYQDFIHQQGLPIMSGLRKRLFIDDLAININLPEIRRGFVDELVIPGYASRDQDVDACQLLSFGSRDRAELIPSLRMLKLNQLLNDYPHYILKFRGKDFVYRRVNLLTGKVDEIKLLSEKKIKEQLGEFKRYVKDSAFPAKEGSCKGCSYNVVKKTGGTLCSEANCEPALTSDFLSGGRLEHVVEGNTLQTRKPKEMLGKIRYKVFVSSELKVRNGVTYTEEVRGLAPHYYLENHFKKLTKIVKGSHIVRDSILDTKTRKLLSEKCYSRMGDYWRRN